MLDLHERDSIVNLMCEFKATADPDEIATIVSNMYGRVEMIIDDKVTAVLTDTPF